MWTNFEIQLKNIPTVGNVNQDNLQKRYYLQENADINEYYKHIKTNK